MAPLELSGRWRLESSQNFEAYVEALAMEPESKQKLLQSSPTLIITQSEMEILIDYEGYNYSVTLLPGLETDHRLLNGRQVQAKSDWKGQSLVTLSTGEQGKTHITTREIVDGKLQQTFEFNGVKAVRTFKKL